MIWIKERFSPAFLRVWRKLFPPTVVLLKGPRLTEGAIMRAMAVEIPGAETFEATMQLIDDLEKECIESSIGLVGEHGACASEVGGFQVLRELRSKMLDLRESGRRGDDQE